MNRAALAVLIALSVAGTACTIAPPPEGAATPAVADSLPPPGFGTLRQEEISMTLQNQDLQIMVTPLAESVILVTAPDTYERLRRIADQHRGNLPTSSVLFLVSFYTQQAEVRFVPEEVQILSRGLRVRPRAIEPVTPTWGQRRVRQRATQMAVYAFTQDVDLGSELTLAYGLAQGGNWAGVLSRVQAELARARARAGIGD